MVESPNPPTKLSKRAARRLIQRAFVLMGRDKALRQYIRKVRLATLWILEDWELTWTVFLERGRFEVARRPAKRPDVTLTWLTSKEFFQQAEQAGVGAPQIEYLLAQVRPRFFEPILRGFFTSLRHVLSHPVDDQGESLL